MKLKLLSFLCLPAVLFLASCKKDSNDTSSPISGNYKFIKFVANTVSITSYTENGVFYKSVTYSEYTTKNNTGNLEIDGSNIKSTGLSYSVDTTTKTDYYENNELIDSFEIPLKVTIPAGDAVTGYKIVTNDSLYVNNGLMFSGGTTTSVEPSGLKYRIEGNQLIFNAAKTQVKTVTQFGVVMTQKATVSAEIIYQKQ
ncbi:MAG: hypothetical protein QM768_09440 [Agriterribacter sp.]